MSKSTPTFPQAYHDFYKTNGLDHAFYCEGPSMTRQEFADECDINSIMARYQTTGALPANNPNPPAFVDWTQVPQSLMETLQFMDEASAAFMQLPAQVRREFDNDPHLFVEYAMDPRNVEQMRDWGLAERPQEPPIVPAPQSPPAGSSSSKKPAEPPKGGSADPAQ